MCVFNTIGMSDAGASRAGLPVRAVRCWWGRGCRRSTSRRSAPHLWAARSCLFYCLFCFVCSFLCVCGFVVVCLCLFVCFFIFVRLFWSRLVSTSDKRHAPHARTRSEENGERFLRERRQRRAHRLFEFQTLLGPQRGDFRAHPRCVGRGR